MWSFFASGSVLSNVLFSDRAPAAPRSIGDAVASPLDDLLSGPQLASVEADWS